MTAEPATDAARLSELTEPAELAELAARYARQAERDRRLDPKVFEAIRRAGFTRRFVPARWGGLEGGFEACLEAVAGVAAEDPSAGWCAAIAATLGRMAGYLPEAGQREVWGQGPDTLVVGALVPAGRAEPRDGGWQLSGSWPYVSGIHASDFALLACRAPMPDGTKHPRFLLVPRSAYRIEESWRTVGMRGTGSDTLVVDGAFVPGHHSFAHTALLHGLSGDGVAACYAVPLPNISALTFAGPVLGAARGALAAWTLAVAGKRTGSGRRPDTAAGTELAYARSSAEIEAAALLLTRVAAQADRGLLSDDAAGTRAQRDQVFAVELLLDAVNRLVRFGGTRALSADARVQRFWRDATAGAAHAVLQWEPAARRFAAFHLDAAAGPESSGL